MNLMVILIVFDFVWLYFLFFNEWSYFWLVCGLMFLIGVFGILFVLLFIDFSICLFFDIFLKVIGLFMGVLGGFFVLGVLMRWVNGFGVMVGVICGIVVMFFFWWYFVINGYFYMICGIMCCFICGYVVSLFLIGCNLKFVGLIIFIFGEIEVEIINEKVVGVLMVWICVMDRSLSRR